MARKNGYCDVGNGSLYFETHGAGTPVVLAQGFGLNHRYWDSFRAALGDGFTTVCYDRRGFGLSSPPRQDVPYSDFGDLSRLLDHLGFSEVHLVSECVGAHVSLEAAVEYPERIKSVVLSNPDAVPGLAGANAAFFKLIDDTRPYHASGDIQKAIDRTFSNPIVAPSLRDERVRFELTRAVAGYHGWHFLHWYPRQGTSPPVTERLAEITAPTLILKGGRDYSHFHKVADVLLASIPGSRAETLPDAGHYACLEFPQESARIVRDFIAAQVG